MGVIEFYCMWERSYIESLLWSVTPLSRSDLDLALTNAGAPSTRDHFVAFICKQFSKKVGHIIGCRKALAVNSDKISINSIIPSLASYFSVNFTLEDVSHCYFSSNFPFRVLFLVNCVTQFSAHSSCQFKWQVSLSERKQ